MKRQQCKIAELNDRFRKGDSSLGLWLITVGVDALPSDKKQSLIQAMRVYNNFSEDNDPYGEHDFGIVDQDGAEYFWEIICYDKSLQHLSGHPTNLKTTTRVLTLMRAEEYYTTPVHTVALLNHHTVVAAQGVLLE